MISMIFQSLPRREIASLSNEILETSVAEQITEAKSDNIATSTNTVSRQNIANSGY